MIRRSTLVFLTCLAALGTPAMRAKQSVSAAVLPSVASALFTTSLDGDQVLLAQASGDAPVRELDINSKGEAVKALQTRLRQSGYYKGSIDGLYGLDTQRAVSEFQGDADLEQTGTVNDETYRKLRVASENSVETSTEAGADVSQQGAAAPETLETAPTASELPNGEEGADVLNIADAEAGGIGKVFGIGLGISAVLASFGVGFFIANRDKRDKSQEGEWGEIEPSTGQPVSASLDSPQSAAEDAGTQPSSYASSRNSKGHSNGAIAPVMQSLSTSGQMGGTSALGKADVIDGLIGDLRNPDPAQRRKAIWELGQRGNSIAMQPLVDSMVDADSKEKSLVLAALSEIGIRSLKPMSRALAIALQDDNPEVRKNAIRDLTRVYDLVVQISQMLGHATEDEDPEVRQTATWALAQLNRIRQGHDDDPNIRAFAGGGGNPSGPIDLLSSEASLRRSQQGL